MSIPPWIAPASERTFRRYETQHNAKKLLEELGDATPSNVPPLAVKLRLARDVDHDFKATQLNLLDDPAGESDALPGPLSGHHAAQHLTQAAPTVDLTDPATLLEQCVIVEPIVNPRFTAAMIASGCTRRGARSFYVPVEFKPYAQNMILSRALSIIPGEVVYDAVSWDRGLQQRARSKGTSEEIKRFKLSSHPVPTVKDQPESGELARCGVVIRASDHGLWAKVCTRPGQWMTSDSPLHRWSERDVLPSQPVFPDEALLTCWHASQDGLQIIDVDGILEALERLVRGSASARQVPSMPNLAILVEGQADGMPVRAKQTTAEHAHRIVAERQQAGDRIAMHFRVEDAALMATAKPSLDSCLLGPQADMVASMLATDLGALNASAVGTGKTVQTLRAMRTVAQTAPAYRGLVICAKELRSQWGIEEIPNREHGFPEARVLILELGRSVAQQLAQFDRDCGHEPGVIVCSYEVARLRTDDLRVLTYDHLVVDEAARLGNPTTQLAKAVRRIRGRARVCFGLTATPVGRKLEELDAIMGVIRDDEDMIRKRIIGRRFNSLDGTSMRRLRQAFGPTLLRITREDLKDYMPEVLPATHQMLDGTLAENELIHAAEHRVAELYRDLLAQLERARKARPDDSGLDEARKALSSTTGLLVSAGEIALLASVDPEALLYSNSKAASLLIADGLVQEAIDRGPTLRTVVAETIAGAVASGEPVLVFSQFSKVLALLHRELADVHGTEAGLFIGQTSSEEREHLKKRFQDGDLRCLLLSSVGDEGHNLQTRDADGQVVIHYDLPWVPRVMEQRTGRAGRIGGSAKAVHVLVPYLRGSTMERVAGLLIPRAATAHAALDQTRGIEQSEIGRQLAGLAGEIAEQTGSVLMQVCATVLGEHHGELAAA